MAAKVVKVINVRDMGKLKRVQVHHSNLSGLSRYEKKVMSYEAY